MRILYVHNINQVAEVYTRELHRRGHFTELYEPSLSGASAPLPIKFAMMPERIFDMRCIVGKLNRNYFDVVHIHWASYGLLGSVSHIPFIVHCHGNDVRKRLNHPFFRPVLTSFFDAPPVSCASLLISCLLFAQFVQMLFFHLRQLILSGLRLASASETAQGDRGRFYSSRASIRKRALTLRRRE